MPGSGHWAAPEILSVVVGAGWSGETLVRCLAAQSELVC